MTTSSPSTSYRHLFVGLEALTPVLDGSQQPYINLDNAASTPSFQAVQEAVDRFLIYYSSVHRGTGFKSQLSTHAYEQARQAVLHFVGADPHQHTCIFVKNTTEAINKLSHRFPFTEKRNLVLTTGMEHHSNDLPWRAATSTIHVGLLPDGRLDEQDFDRQLEAYGDRIALVAVTAASNVTGYLNPIQRLAEKAHRAGAQIAVDCAQFAPHRQVDMGPLEDPSHLDYVSLSAHKMYAPFGSGALVGRRDTFERGDPDQRGGGTVEIVTLEDVVWSEPPEREEAGSPNTVGAIALGAATCQMEAVGMQNVASHEAELTAYALERMATIPGMRVYGDSHPEGAASRLGVIPLSIDHVPHFLTASVLGYEFGIGVRSGCFCAHPYILHILGLTPEESRIARARIISGDKSEMPGLIRISFGLYNVKEEVDRLIEALTHISQGKYEGKYIQEKATGEYHPENWTPDFDRYFSFQI